MLASNADTHRTPGAIRRSISRSGPIPKGNRLTTTTKKKRGISASDLRSKATSKSRRITTNTGWATRGWLTGSCPHPDGLRSFHGQLLVTCQNDHSATGLVPMDHFTKPSRTEFVQRCGGLVENP